MDKLTLQDHVTNILSLVGENPQRNGLLETPRRVASFYEEVLSGYRENPFEHATSFPSEGHNMISVRDIRFFSLCEHHLVPFFGTVDIAYVPNKKILGLSKFGRIVDVFAKRLQVQERLTNEISQTLITILDPLGLAVRIDAEHLCMSMRGVKKENAHTLTTAFYGNLENNEILRKEFLGSSS